MTLIVSAKAGPKGPIALTASSAAEALEEAKRLIASGHTGVHIRDLDGAVYEPDEFERRVHPDA